MTTPTKERGLICTAEQVRAILNGATQFRRPIEPQPNAGPGGELVDLGGNIWGLLDGDLSGKWPCPFGSPGERLWVRESWRVPGDWANEKDSTATCTGPHDCDFAADFAGDELSMREWRSSATMPRWASRITLKVKRRWVERVQEISEADAIAGGCPHFGRGTLNSYGAEILETCHEWFTRFWDSTYASKGYAWESNPWVWCVEYNKVN